MLHIYLGIIESEQGQDKFTELYYEHRQLMFHIANEILHNPQDAEDALQIAFTNIAENIEKILGMDEIRTRSYVCITAKNAAINMYNHRKRNNSVPIEEAEEIADESVEIEHQAMLNMDIATMKRALEMLPEKYFDVLYLELNNGLNAKEIAAVLGVSEETARKRVQRAKKKLKEILEGMEEFNG